MVSISKRISYNMPRRNVLFIFDAVVEKCKPKGLCQEVRSAKGHDLVDVHACG